MSSYVHLREFHLKQIYLLAKWPRWHCDLQNCESRNKVEKALTTCLLFSSSSIKSLILAENNNVQDDFFPLEAFDTSNNNKTMTDKQVCKHVNSTFLSRILRRCMSILPGFFSRGFFFSVHTFFYVKTISLTHFSFQVMLAWIMHSNSKILPKPLKLEHFAEILPHNSLFVIWWLKQGKFRISPIVFLISKYYLPSFR